MRRKEKEITDKRIISEILMKSEVCRLGFVDKGEAYIVPVNYAYDNGKIYIHSAPEGRKIELIKQNNHVTFETELATEITRDNIPCNWSAKYRSVMGAGTISILSDKLSKERALDKIMKKYGADTELKYNESSISKMVILELTITSLTAKQSGDW
ncbi:MAG TPA: pyridoxamine 5'-phosphate oxidase family protein [Bacteroidales bacterium]|nr:pyridoxamine 5'-phosphate oxidase family protein [Bacteroidales bacterium]